MTARIPAQVTYSVEVSSIENDKRRTLVVCGAPNISDALASAFEHGVFYIGREKSKIEARVTALCLRCSGTGEVNKPGRIRFAKRVCPDCKGKALPQPIAEPIRISTGTIVGLKVTVD